MKYFKYTASDIHNLQNTVYKLSKDNIHKGRKADGLYK